MWNVYEGKTVLLTGHTGFKGGWLALWLQALGARVIGVALAPTSQPSLFTAASVADIVQDHRIDIRDTETIRQLIDNEKPDFVFHLAAQALVRKSYADPLETLSSNALGTASILDALRTATHPTIAVMITSDKVYDNVEWSWGYREIDPLGGKDPYSASKGMAELAIKTYFQSYFAESELVRLGVARAGNVIGGGDWAADRIVPDCVRAWAQHKVVDIRSPQATRPWQHVLEPLSGYLTLGEALYSNARLNGEAYNFGPPAGHDFTVGALIDEMSKHWSEVRWNDVSAQSNTQREAGLLKLNCDKAMSDLGWEAVLSFEETIAMTAEWYKTFYESSPEDMIDFTRQQIKEYVQKRSDTSHKASAAK
jgi:CDP-glucose 4,6-dehydratase